MHLGWFDGHPAFGDNAASLGWPRRVFGIVFLSTDSPMGFASGSVSFRRFAVLGDHPETVEPVLLDKLSELALRPNDMGLPEEIEYGWSGGRHVLDGTFSFQHNVFADALLFGLRIDTNKVPNDLKKAYQIMEEDAVAATNPSGFISKQQKKDVKDTIGRKIDEELRTGKYRRSKVVPMLWDLPTRTLMAAVGGKSMEMLLEIFERTFGLTLMPLSAGSIALRELEPQGRRRDYEDLRPTRFVPGPEGEGQYPEYPWVSKGPEPKDFVGNEFLAWLWHEAEVRDGEIKTDGGGVISVFIDRALDLDCAYGQSGKDGLRGDGPARMPEARDGLRSGKVPRKAGLLLHASGQDFSLTFNPEIFSIGSAKLPEVEDADTPRTLFEERISLMRDLCRVVDSLFAAFLKIRASGSWESQVAGIRRWILQPVKATAAA